MDMCMKMKMYTHMCKYPTAANQLEEDDEELLSLLVLLLLLLLLPATASGGGFHNRSRSAPAASTRSSEGISAKICARPNSCNYNKHRKIRELGRNLRTIVWGFHLCTYHYTYSIAPLPGHWAALKRKQKMQSLPPYNCRA